MSYTTDLPESCDCPHPDLCMHPSHDLVRFRNDKSTLQAVLSSGESDAWVVEKVRGIVAAMP